MFSVLGEFLASFGNFLLFRAAHTRLLNRMGKKDEMRFFLELVSGPRSEKNHSQTHGGWVPKMVCRRFLVRCCVKETIKKANKTAFCLESILAFLDGFWIPEHFSEFSGLLTNCKHSQPWQQKKLIAEFLGDLPWGLCHLLLQLLGGFSGFFSLFWPEDGFHLWGVTGTF